MLQEPDLHPFDAPFTCPKCGGHTYSRHFCPARPYDASLGCRVETGLEHHHGHCYDCHYAFYEALKPAAVPLYQIACPNCHGGDLILSPCDKTTGCPAGYDGLMHHYACRGCGWTWLDPSVRPPLPFIQQANRSLFRRLWFWLGLPFREPDPEPQ